MRKIFAFVLSVFALSFAVPAMAHAGPTTWYVRADGGTRYSISNQNGQCNGMADVAYPGNGVNQPCALKDPRYLYSDGKASAYQWIIAGGDTVLLRGGPWRIGQDTSSGCAPFSNQCSADGAAIPPPPAGTAGQPTTIRGENYASCTTKPKTQLFGGYTLNSVFDLHGTNNVQLQCLELTDHSQCTTLGAKPVACDRSIIEDYAKNGIYTNQNTHDIGLTDVDVHGFRDNGIVGAVGGLVTATRVRVAFNGNAGWNFDDGLQTRSVNGQINWSYVTIEGNGCIEEYPLVHQFPAAYCYDDGNGGYGDGVGTPDTQISFRLDHALIRYNTQDGLDILHTTGSNITLTNSTFYGNMGNQWKIGPMAFVQVQDNITVTNCRRMAEQIQDAPSGWNAGLTDFCRANAGTVMVQRGDHVGGGTYLFQNNTFVGYAGDAMFESGNCTDSFMYAPTNDCNTPDIVFQNNLMVGYSNPNYYQGQLPPTGTDGDNIKRFKTLNHNIYYNMRTLPADGVGTNPFLAEMPAFTNEASLDGVDGHLTLLSSNAIGMGVSISGLNKDITGMSWAAPPSIGAYEYGSGTSTGSSGSGSSGSGSSGSGSSGSGSSGSGSSGAGSSGSGSSGSGSSGSGSGGGSGGSGSSGSGSSGGSGSGGGSGSTSSYTTTMQVAVTCTLVGTTLSCSTK